MKLHMCSPKINFKFQLYVWCFIHEMETLQVELVSVSKCLTDSSLTACFSPIIYKRESELELEERQGKLVSFENEKNSTSANDSDIKRK